MCLLSSSNSIAIISWETKVSGYQYQNNSIFKPSFANFKFTMLTQKYFVSHALWVELFFNSQNGPFFDQVSLHRFKKKNKRLKIKNNLITRTFFLRLFLYVNPQFTFHFLSSLFTSFLYTHLTSINPNRKPQSFSSFSLLVCGLQLRCNNLVCGLAETAHPWVPLPTTTATHHHLLTSHHFHLSHSTSSFFTPLSFSS